MNRKSNSGTGMFLLEMMVVVCFFIVCASVCVLAFVKAGRMSRLAAERNHAVSAAESMAEVWKLEGIEGLRERMNARVDSDSPDICVVWWDADWNTAESGASQPYFEGSLQSMSDGQGMETASVEIWRTADSKVLFTLDACRYKRP